MATPSHCVNGFGREFNASCGIYGKMKTRVEGTFLDSVPTVQYGDDLVCRRMHERDSVDDLATSRNNPVLSTSMPPRTRKEIMPWLPGFVSQIVFRRV